MKCDVKSSHKVLHESMELSVIPFELGHCCPFQCEDGQLTLQDSHYLVEVEGIVHMFDMLVGVTGSVIIL